MTLVELLIALVVFVIISAAGFASLKLGMGLVDNARHQTRSSQILQSEIESIRSLPWGQLTALPTTRTNVQIATQFGNAGNYTAYTMYRTIATTGGSSDTRKITLEVEWSDIDGRAQSKTYVTQYTKGGLYDYIQ